MAKLVRLAPLGLNDVPTHHDLQQETAPTLTNFIKDVFDEAKNIETLPRYERKGTKKFRIAGSWYHIANKNKANTVEVTKVRSDHDSSYPWFGRTSKFNGADYNAGEPVTYRQLRYALFQDHSEHEMEYTPNIFDCNTVLEWPGEALDAVARELGYHGLNMQITNLYHEMPKLFDDRVFTVLLLSAETNSTDVDGPEVPMPARQQTREFVIVQIPVDLTTFPNRVKERAHHSLVDTRFMQYISPVSPDAAPQDGKQKMQQKKHGKDLVPGVYVSIENVYHKVRKNLANDDAGERVSTVDWQMATASNARGHIPLWIQNLAVPGKIAKDVPIVVKWLRNLNKVNELSRRMGDAPDSVEEGPHGGSGGGPPSPPAPAPPGPPLRE